MQKNKMNLLSRTKSYIIRTIRQSAGKRLAKKLGISFYPPNYIYFDKLNSSSVVVDVGCADDPDYSEHIINTHGCKCYGVDPTRKHFSALRIIENKYNGLFKHLPYAVVNQTGKINFNESVDNASGSILKDHVNIKKDEVIAYEVEALSIPDLKDRIGTRIDILKLDLEGAEYELLENLNKEDLLDIDQFFIEFHHHSIDRYRLADTTKLVKKLESFGFSSFSLDGVNFLFYI
jgi:FkbM family methyltransferase